MNISCMVKAVKDEIQEELKEEVKEEEPKMTIEELKEILTENLDNKNTALSYVRTIKQVYDYFKVMTLYIITKRTRNHKFY